MAQDIVGSLFDIQQQPDYSAQDYRNAMAMAELGKGGMGRFVGGMLGSQLGRTAGQALGSLFGAQDPRLQQASVIREAQQQGFDVTSPEGLQQLAQFFVQRGQPGLASQVAMQAQTMSRSAAEEQYKLAQAQAALKEKLPTAAKELIAAGYTPDSPEFQAKMRQIIEADITGKAKGSGSSTSVTIDAGSLAKAMGMDVGKQAAGVEGKYSALDSLAEAKKKLKSGIYAGAYGPEQMAAAKYTLGAAGSAKKVQNTEEFMSYIGNTVVPRLQEFGGNDSVEELKYLQRIMGGDQRLEPKSLENILNSAEKKINRGIERLQSQTQAAGKKAPPPLGPGASREAEAKKPIRVYNLSTGKFEEK